MRIRRHPERTASDAYYAGHVGIGIRPLQPPHRLERLPAPHSPWSTAPRPSYATRSPSAVAPPASKKARLGAVPIKPRCHEALERCGQSSTPVTPFRAAVLSPFPAASTPPCSVGLPLPELVMSSAGPFQAGRAVKEYLATLDDAAYGAATDVLPGKAAVAADAFGLCP